ncbi:hypothetical protein BDP55DRAFT_635747 [Colletotrichum godetiae]|uniref:Uncharacterized protein n=1 Tax=Colletotrichum godetiae TaxID=1209918 RepID=A0AAJ0ACP5_9PEZI|nr:uncharacterized protein BDP55DRAFT_635747 [Colletotrichum godetiae]KAK1671490.1 hypothetical protein BDP55DRAFT_635747 [Colletotrichum godetiae]
MLLPTPTALYFLLAITMAATSQSTSIPSLSPSPSPSQPPIDDGTVCPGNTVSCHEGCIPPDAVCCHASSETWWCRKGMVCGKHEAGGCIHPPHQASPSSSAPTTSHDSFATGTERVLRASLTAVTTTTTSGRQLPTCVFEMPPIVHRQRRETETTTVSVCPTELASATSVPGAARGSGPAVIGQSWVVVMLV